MRRRHTSAAVTMRSVTPSCQPETRAAAPPDAADQRSTEQLSTHQRNPAAEPDVERFAPVAVAAAAITPAAARRRTTSDRIVATPRMRAMLTELVESQGPRRVLIEWPLTARCVPAGCHRASSRDVIIGHVASCPIFIDLQYLAWFFTNGVLVLDLDPHHDTDVDGTLRLLLNPAEGRPLASNV